MGLRTELGDLLRGVLTATGYNETAVQDMVHFQPPQNYRLTYPCIIYSLADIDTMFADNKPYLHQRKYTVTVIDRNPDSKIPNGVLQLPRCSFDRPYTADNLYHWVFTIYY